MPEKMRREMLEIVVRGRHDSGKTTAANLIKGYLEESGFRDVKVADLPPLPVGEKPDFMSRLLRNRDRPARIRVELVEG